MKAAQKMSGLAVASAIISNPVVAEVASSFSQAAIKHVLPEARRTLRIASRPAYRRARTYVRRRTGRSLPRYKTARRSLRGYRRRYRRRNRR